jgi:DNA-binding HxlR family transcriptional regulator
MPDTNSALPRLTGARDGWVPPTDHCPVSIGARLIADRWTLLIVREMLVGATRFNAIHRALPTMSRTLLATRLRYLVRIGVVEHSSDTGEYRLTAAGIALRPVLEALGAWTLDWRVSPSTDADLNVGALLWQMHLGLQRDRLPSGGIVLAFRFPDQNPGEAWMYVDDQASGACIGTPEREPDLTVIVDLRVLNELWWGKRQCAVAIAEGDVGFRGAETLARAYPTWFLPQRLTA